MSNADKLKSIKSRLTRQVNAQHKDNFDINNVIDLLRELSKIKTVMSARVALNALKIENYEIEIYVAETLDKVGNKYGDVFIDIINNTHDYGALLSMLTFIKYREYAIGILNQIIDMELGHDDINYELIKAVADVMLEIPDYRMLSSLEYMLLLDDEFISFPVIQALRAIGESAINVIVDGLGDSSEDVREIAFDTLKTFDSNDVVDAIFNNISNLYDKNKLDDYIGYYLKYGELAKDRLKTILASDDTYEQKTALLISYHAGLLGIIDKTATASKAVADINNQIRIYTNCKMDTVYYDETSADLSCDCELKFASNKIVVSYKNDDDYIVYKGESKGYGHYLLTSPNNNGRASLHMFADSSYLDGYWEEGGDTGFWRIELGELKC